MEHDVSPRPFRLGARAHNPKGERAPVALCREPTEAAAETVGSNPAPATKSVTVVDTISTTVIFYLFPFWGCFWKETGNISNISSHKQIVCPDLMQPQAEKTRLGKMTIVIRI